MPKLCTHHNPRPLSPSELKYLKPQPYPLVTPSLAGKNRLGPKLSITPPTRGKSGTQGVVLGEFIFGRRRWVPRTKGKGVCAIFAGRIVVGDRNPEGIGIPILREVTSLEQDLYFDKFSNKGKDRFGGTGKAPCKELVISDYREAVRVKKAKDGVGFYTGTGSDVHVEEANALEAEGDQDEALYDNTRRKWGVSVDYGGHSRLLSLYRSVTNLTIPPLENFFSERVEKTAAIPKTARHASDGRRSSMHLPPPCSQNWQSSHRAPSPRDRDRFRSLPIPRWWWAQVRILLLSHRRTASGWQKVRWLAPSTPYVARTL